MALVKKLTKIGNSCGLIVPREFMESAGLSEKSQVELEIRGDELVVRPARLKDYKVMKTFMTVVRDYDKLFKKLAKPA